MADAVVIGGGIAGVSAAFELADAGLDVTLVEKEQQLAHHTTGRSAATFLLSYGPPEVRALTAASVVDYAEFPERLGTPPLLSPRSAMWLAPPAQLGHLESMLAEVDSLQRISPQEAEAICPQVRGDLISAAAYEDDAAEIDVLALHQGYVRGLIGAGGRVERAWPVRAIAAPERRWVVRRGGRRFDRGRPRGARRRRVVRRAGLARRRPPARPAAAAPHDRHLPHRPGHRSGRAPRRRRRPHVLLAGRGPERARARRPTRRRASRATPAPTSSTSPSPWSG